MKARTVYPVEGRYLNDVPATEHECIDARCTDSGAFTDQPPPKTLHLKASADAVVVGKDEKE